MKLKKQLAVCLVAAVSLLAFPGCSPNLSPQLANELSFSLDGISEVSISYDEENITFFPSETSDLTIKEYMTQNKSGYYAKTSQSGGSIKISEGGKPLFKDGFLRYIEVYLPASYQQSLTVTTTNGSIGFSQTSLSLNALRVDSTSGTVHLDTVEAQSIHLSTTSGVLDTGRLRADTVRIDTTSGSFSCQRLEGNVSYTTTSGDAEIQSAIGSGSYRANNSGKLHAAYTEVTGDLSFFNKNGSICVALPAGLEFVFEAAAKNGSITTSFPECVSIDGRTTSGTVGAHPTVTVKVETKNGNIEVTQ